MRSDSTRVLPASCLTIVTPSSPVLLASTGEMKASPANPAPAVAAAVNTARRVKLTVLALVSSTTPTSSCRRGLPTAIGHYPTSGLAHKAKLMRLRDLPISLDGRLLGRCRLCNAAPIKSRYRPHGAGAGGQAAPCPCSAALRPWPPS